MILKLTALLASTTILSACAVTQETTTAEVQLDGAVAKTQASALSAAVSSANADDGIAVTQAVASIGDVAAALLPPTKDGAQRRVKMDASTCSCDTATKSCAFDRCTIGSATVSGALSWSGGQIKCTGLTFDVGATSTTIGAAAVSVECALSYGTAQLSGSVHTTGRAVVQNVTYRWDATLDASGVTFTSSAFTGGSLAVDATVTSSGGAASAKTYSASATIALP